MATPAPLADRFELLERAGAGGMGEVWRARDRSTGALVALKLLLGSDALLLARFAREADALARVAHPDVVRFLDRGVDPARGPWLAMAWLDGEPLSARLARGRMEEAEACLLGARLAGALAALHAEGLVHRDLKPANVILRLGDGPCLVDLGIVRSLEATSALTQGLRVGTPRYMSPEQVRGSPPADARSDLWSLGVVLYQALSGTTPYDGAEALAVLAKILLEPVPPLDERAPDVSPAVAALVMRLLARDRIHRPASAAEVAGALEALAASAAAAPPAAPSSRSPAPRAGPGAPSASPAAGAGPALGTARRLAAVLVVAPPPEATGPEAIGLAFTVDAVAKVLRARALRAGTLGVVVTVPDRDAVREQAWILCRCALAVRASAPRARLALGLSRAGDGEADASVGGVIDRAASQLALPPAREAVAIDAPSAALVADRFFVLQGSAATMSLVGERADRAGEGPASLGTSPLGASPLEGRDAELAAVLEQAAVALARGGARAACTLGDVGVGKTRFAAEVVTRLRAQVPELWVWSAAGDPTRDGAPWELSRALVESGLGLHALAEPEERAARIDALLGGVVSGPEREGATAALVALVQRSRAPTAAPAAVDRLELVAEGDRIQHALSCLLDAASAARPLLIVIDDAHWGDGATAEGLARALSRRPDRPLFVWFLGRRGAEARLAPLARAAAAPQVLGDLNDAATLRLARRALVGARDPAQADALARQIAAAAGGNPRFARELLREAARGRSGAVPASVLALAEERLAALSPTEARVLRVASVFGTTFPPEALAALLGDVPTPERDRTVASLLGPWLVAADAAWQGALGHLAFRHGVLRDAAYAQLAPADRAEAHRRVAAWLESQGEHDGARIAAHLVAGERPAEAAPHLARATERAVAAGAFTAAEALGAEALSLGTRAEDRARAAVALAEARRFRGAHEDALAAATIALEAAAGERAAGRSERWFQAAGELIGAVSRLRRLGELATVAASLEPTLGPVPTPAQATAVARAAMLLLHANVTARSAPLYAWLETIADQLELFPAAASRVLFAFAWRAQVQGEWSHYERLLVRALAAADLAADLRLGCQIRANCGHARLELGDLAGAEEALWPALDTAQRLGIAPTVAICQNNLGLAVGKGRDLPAGIALERSAVAAYAAAGDARLEAGSRIYLAELLRLGGHLAEAMAEAQRAVELAAQSPPLLPHALGQLAEARRAAGDRGGARESALRARAAIEAAGRVEGQATPIWLAIAEALLATGDAEGSAAAAREARAASVARAWKIDAGPTRERFLASQGQARIVALSS